MYFEMLVKFHTFPIECEHSNNDKFHEPHESTVQISSNITNYECIKV